MLVLILGLILFLGSHSVRIFAEDWRRSMIQRLGEGPWKGLYSLVSIVGFVLVVWGYGIARQDPVLLWTTPEWLRHVTLTLNLIALLLFGFYLVPAGKLKPRLGHPMLLAVKVWAFAHLLANGTLADLLLFGGFLVWAIADFAASRRRERAAGTIRIAGPVRNDVIAIVVGAVLYVALVWRVHEWLTDRNPLA